MNQLNERLGQLIAAREIDRLGRPDLRVARNLAAMLHPLLYPNVGGVLRITQQELGWIRVEYGGMRLLDLQALRHGQL